MSLPFINATERLARKRSIKVGVAGVPGIGKTSLIWALPHESTLHVEIEDGDLSIAQWPGEVYRPQTWDQFRDLVVAIAGPSPTASAGQPYTEVHYKRVCQEIGDPGRMARYQYVVFDSLSALSRLCLQWAKAQPQATTEKGRPDMRAAYGLLANEMVNAISVLQHVQDKHLIYIVILNEKVDDKGVKSYELQLEGGKTAAEFPGVIDILVTLTLQPSPSGTKRMFVTNQDNPLGLPAKDRSGQLDPFEEPKLDRLIAKCLGQPTQ